MHVPCRCACVLVRGAQATVESHSMGDSMALVEIPVQMLFSPSPVAVVCGPERNHGEVT